MNLKVDEMALKFHGEQFKRVGEKLQEAYDQMKKTFDNTMWRAGLKRFESRMLIDAEEEFMIKELGGDKIKADRISKIGKEYRNLISYYETKAEMDLQFHKAGFEPVDPPYDYNITDIDEACRRYLGCNKSDAEKIYHLYQIAEDRTLQFITDIRLNYKGDLALQLGKNKEEYEKAYPEIPLPNFEFPNKTK